MAIDATKLFAATSGQVAPKSGSPWKTASADSSEHFKAVAKPKAAAKTDQVEVSELGKALTGKAADLFGHLDKKVRGKLEDLVKTKMISAEEVNLGLRAEATFALFGRFMSEAAPNDEQKALSARGQEVRKAEDAKDAELYGVFGEYAQNRNRGIDTPEAMDALMKTMDGIREKEAAIRAKYDPDDGKSNSDELGELAQAHFRINFERFKQLDLGEDDYRGDKLVSDKEMAAKDKLSNLLDKTGVDWPKYMYDSRRYAASVNIPGLGKGAELPPWESREKGPGTR
ncbi:hypothetical protein [Azospirillum sp. sgz302134]